MVMTVTFYIENILHSVICYFYSIMLLWVFYPYFCLLNASTVIL